MMNDQDKLSPPLSCASCPVASSHDVIINHLLEVKGQLGEMLHAILCHREKETIYRSTEYVQNRVGISESTLLRCKHKGLIKVAKIVNKKKYYRDEDVEHLRKIYWSLE
ncbi:hypothetical protein [Olivibacter sitiensis]|uniref:hypothetical protein n=1 Tax=Olivibacter sitiensis TaxID=376470 RepID=UPI000484DC5B|nr:hypothetical protein [Olivibacter sitiensis]